MFPRSTPFLVFFLLPIATSFVIPAGPKLELLKRFHDYVTAFFTPDQVARSIDIAALDIHQGKTTEDIIDDVDLYIRSRLSPNQALKISAVRDGLRAQLGSEELAETVMKRARHVVAYAITPGVEKVRANGTTPEAAYYTMLNLFTPDYVIAVKHLVKMTLTDAEWNALVSSARPVIDLE